MATPTTGIRQGTYTRDNNRCVSCTARTGLTFQHRRGVGAGGTKLSPSIEDGLTACMTCNDSYENTRQAVALAMGWKVRRWVKHPEYVPVFYFNERSWYVLSAGGRRDRIGVNAALKMMRDVYGPTFTFEKGPVK
jgi:hypothetical protein